MKNLEIVAIEIVEGCNLNCEFCARNAHNIKKEMPIEDIVCFVTDALDCKAEQIALTGGEPLLHNRIIDIVDILDEYKVFFSITTNGTILNEYLLKKLKKSEYFKHFLISVDSCKKETHDSIRNQVGTFDRILTFINALKKYDIDFLINMTVTHSNLYDIYDTVFWSKSIGAKDISVSMAKPSGRGKADLSSKEIRTYAAEIRKSISLIDDFFNVWATEITIFLHHFDLYEDDYNQGNCYSCSFGESSLHIAFNGDVKGCATCDFVLGNLYEANSISDIWINNETLNKIRSKEYLSGECGKCKYKNYCGGCRCRAYSLCGDLFGDDLYCPLIGDSKNV